MGRLGNHILGNHSEKLDTFWTFSAQEAAVAVQADVKNGLCSCEAELRLKRYGYNTLKGNSEVTTLFLFLNQFNNPLIIILLFCSVISFLLYDKTNAAIIFSIVLASCVLSFFQEKNALNVMDKLLQIVRTTSTVIRDQNQKEVPIDEIVPGDLVELSAGSIVPGDCYILESKDLFVDEATLTGESFYAEKAPGKVDADVPLSKRTNALFMGTHVVSGTAIALVIQTGFQTIFGKISTKLTQQAPETEFERGIRQFGYLLLKVTVVLLIAIFALNVYLQRPFVESLLFSLALAVGLTPQLLPAIISINLSKGAKRMAAKKVIVKRLSSIEDFGSMNILCCDKTGTLTYGDTRLDRALNSSGAPSDKAMLFARLNAYFQSGYSNPIDKAILKASQGELSGWSKLDELPYSFDRKRLSLLLSDRSNSWLITKGAFRPVLQICTKGETIDGKEVDIQILSKNLQTTYEECGNQGFKVIGIAYRKMGTSSTINLADEEQMTFLGFLLFSDAPKEFSDRACCQLFL